METGREPYRAEIAAFFSVLLSKDVKNVMKNGCGVAQLMCVRNGHHFFLLSTLAKCN